MDHKWLHANATLIGSAHLSTGLPCQDKVSYYEVGNVQVITLADGLGSKHLSHVGAKLFTNAVGTYLAKNFDTAYNDEQLGMTLISICKKTLSDYQAYQERDAVTDIGEYKTTLMFVAINGSYYIIGHVGDGAVIGYSKTLGARVISRQEEMGFGDGVTLTVLDEDAADFFYIERNEIKKYSGFILTSDGLQNIIYYHDTCESGESATSILNYVANYREYDQKQMEDVLRDDFLSGIRDAGYSDDDLGIAVLCLPQRYEAKTSNRLWRCECGFQNDLDQMYCSKCGCSFNAVYDIKNCVFTDKVIFFSSLEQIIQNTKRLPIENSTYWICRCGHFNPSITDRCEKCGLDFTTVYSGIQWKEKTRFIERINAIIGANSQQKKEDSIEKNDNADLESDIRDSNENDDTFEMCDGLEITEEMNYNDSLEKKERLISESGVGAKKTLEHWMNIFFHEK